MKTYVITAPKLNGFLYKRKVNFIVNIILMRKSLNRFKKTEFFFIFFSLPFQISFTFFSDSLFDLNVIITWLLGRKMRRGFQRILRNRVVNVSKPLTLEQPKVLLPLVNVPMIDYTLAWLESAGIEEVFVFCCAHWMQVIDYLNNSELYSNQDLLVKTIESHKSFSAGDALRYIYEQQVETSQIHGDFVLVSGDTVSNMPLVHLIQEHRERKKKDDKAIMTMVIKQSKPSPGTDQLFIALDPLTKQLLYYEEEDDDPLVCLDKSLVDSNPSVLLCSDMQDCYIDICSPEVLSIFADNFDYQHLRRDFVKGVLDDDIMGYKIFTHEIRSSYAARIDSFRTYDTVSNDIIQRWTFPYVPDMNFSGNRPLKLGRQGTYRAFDAILSRSGDVGASTVVGYGTKIGSGGKIFNSVIGNGCCIGSNVVIQGSYIWNNVTIEDVTIEGQWSIFKRKMFSFI